MPIRLYSNCLQKFVNYTDVLPDNSTDYSRVLISLPNDSSDNNGRGVWKHNSSLAYDEFYVEYMKKLITKIDTLNEFLKDTQMKWEILKFGFRKFAKNSC